MPFWKRSPLVDSSYADFAFECFEWHLRNTKTFWTRPLVQPNDRFFPQKGLQGHDLALAVFEVVRRVSGLHQRSIRLEAQDPGPNTRLGALVSTRGAGLPEGTFQRLEREALITYDPSLTGDPILLVATIATQLAHYLMYTFRDRPPWVEGSYWQTTEIGAVFLGCGLFLAGSHFEFSQHTDTFSKGWHTRTRGQLSEPQILYALAIFCALRAVPADEVLPYLKGHLRGSYKKAFREVSDRAPQIDALRAIRRETGVELQSLPTG